MSHRIIVRKHEKVKYNQSSFFTLAHNFYDHDCYMETHWHNSIEITYVVNGTKIQNMEGKHIVADKGTLLLVNSGVSHDVDVKQGLEGIVLLLDRNYIDYYCPQVINKRFDLNKNNEAKQKITECLLQAVAEKHRNNQIKCTIEILKIIDILVTDLLDYNYYVQEKHDDEVYEMIISIAEYLDYNYQKKITLDNLATITNYNKTYLSATFKKKIGVTIFEYLRNVRLQHCLDDLKYSDESIVNIALNNGFSNIQVFNRTFKELFNMTPKEYREKSLKNL